MASSGAGTAGSGAETRAALPFMGNAAVAPVDPAGAVGPGTLRAESEVGECMPGSAAECRIVTIYHAFREPLDFNVVSTIVWGGRRNAWQNLFSRGVHAAGESLNPSHGAGAGGGARVPCPLIAGQVGEDGDGTHDHGGRRVTCVPGAECGVHGLAPDGTCRPVRNLAATRHEADGSMYNRERPARHGLARGTAVFDEAPGREREAAQGRLRLMGMAPRGEAAPAAEPREPAGAGGQLRLPRERIARETDLAGPATLELYPGMDGGPGEAAAGGAGAPG